ncbi:MAG: SIMPL domain-containing protein [Patescibacteria group bacterium]|nr:SIMPL domain-containing protein [Patescibacteria group bacterium]
MNVKLKNSAVVIIIIAAVVLAYSAFVYANSFSRSISPSSFRSFSVSGEGKSVSIPDIAQFSFGLTTQGGKNINVLQKENSDKINKVLDFLKENNIDPKDIKTQNYNLEPRYQYYNCSHPESSITPCPPAEIVGYTISQNISVKIRDFGKIGDILSGIVKNGANSVSQLSFDIDNKDKVESEARTEAVKKAQIKAEETAKAGGFKLGKLLSIEESYSAIPRYYAMKGLGMGGTISESTTPNIEPGSQETTVNVVLKYEIR